MNTYAPLAGLLLGMRLAPRRFGGARLAFFRGVEALCKALGGRRFYRWNTLRLLQAREERVEVPGLAPDLEGLVIAQVSDLHAGPYLGAGDLGPMVALLEERQPHLVAVTGDLCVHAVDEAFPIIEELCAYQAPLGSYVVFGNHDYKHRREGELAERLAAAGAVVLRNEGVRVPVGGAALAVTGIEDLEEGKVVDPERARAGLRPGDVEILLCHNPGGGPALARPGCAVILSGHSHGGQIDLPFLRRLGPPHPGLRVALGPTTLIVSRGIGALGIPLRVGAPAEVVFITLSRA
jgi:predicted MPP superfamily phosphohydrolase